jgi:hypothetical protein
VCGIFVAVASFLEKNRKEKTFPLSFSLSSFALPAFSRISLFSLFSNARREGETGVLDCELRCRLFVQLFCFSLESISKRRRNLLRRFDSNNRERKKGWGLKKKKL